MRVFASWSCIFWLTSIAVAVEQQPATKPARGAAQKQPAAPDTADKAIRQTAVVFTDAFNRGDARQLADLWTDDAEYVDERGERLSGRAAIQKKYAEFFAANPGAKIEIAIDAVHLLSGDAAIEDGHAQVTRGANAAPERGRYTVTHVLQKGVWRMASVRDIPAEPTEDNDALADLEWMIGVWHAEYLGVEMEIHCRWLADKSFVEATYSKQEGETVTPTATHIIGVDPRSREIKTWMFNSDRSYATGNWFPSENGWTIDLSGVRADGAATAAVNQLSRVADALVWKSTHRMIAGQSVPDTEEVVFKRNK